MFNCPDTYKSCKKPFRASLKKQSKYKDLEIEIAHMWQIRTVVIHVVVGALGVIKKGTNNLQEIQRTALLGRAHILRKVFSIK